MIGTKKDTLTILRMIEKRLKVQIQTDNRHDIKLLAKLLSENDPKVYIYYIYNT